MAGSYHRDVSESDGEFLAPRSGLARLQGGLSRRLRQVAARLKNRRRQPVVRSALEWLQRMEISGGVAAMSDSRRASPGTTARAAATIWCYGQRDTARRWLEWLQKQQDPGGAFAQEAGGTVSLLATAESLAGMLELRRSGLDLDDSMVRASDYLAHAIDGHFAILEQLACLPPLLRAAQEFRERSWEDAVWRTMNAVRRTSDLARWNVPLHWLASNIEALERLGFESEAQSALAVPNAVQDRRGGVPALPGTKWFSSAGLAHLVHLWLRRNERDRAAAALALLERKQNTSGGFPGSWGRGACYYPQQETTDTAIRVLSAKLAQVQTSFEADANHFPCSIDPRDGRLEAVRNALAGLPSGSKIADVGCGKGRYLRVLSTIFPGYHWTGIDASRAMLQLLPPAATAKHANLLCLDEPDGAYDAAIAVESIEHALFPEQAVRELVRIVRPGGRLVIIDKQRTHQALSEHDAWEQWFTPGEVTAWLRSGCDRIEVQPISHGQHAQPTGLFLCWTARRRDSAAERHAA